jgi:hypothetical protein
MTRDNEFDDGITTADAFSAALEGLLIGARANGVDIGGGWECHSEDGTAWEAVITEMATGTRVDPGVER